jgi:hypothetical protein
MNESTEWVKDSKGVWVESVNHEKTMKLFTEKFGEYLESLKKGC